MTIFGFVQIPEAMKGRSVDACMYPKHEEVTLYFVHGHTYIQGPGARYSTHDKNSSHATLRNCNSCTHLTTSSMAIILISQVKQLAVLLSC